MRQIINISKANQHLSRYISAVQSGDEVIITRRGLPVAKLSAYTSTSDLNEAQKEARERTRSRMREGYSLYGKAPSRETFHER